MHSLRLLPRINGGYVSTPNTQSKKPGKTLADFRAAHDKNVIIPNKIKAALTKMETEGGPENWNYEADFIRLAGICQTDMGVFRDQFAEHVVEVSGKNPKRVWVASVKAAVKFRG